MKKTKTKAFKRFAAAAMSVLMVGGVIGVGAISTSALDIDTDDTDISTETDLILGDVNSDGDINLEDAIIAQKYSLSLIDFSESQKLCADVDEDSNVNTLDAIYILKHSVGMSTEIEKFGAKWFDAEYEYIEHPAETEEVWIIDQEATTETIPVYERRGRTICNDCGADITNENISLHCAEHLLNGGKGSYFDRWVWLIYGTDEWVVENENAGNTELCLSDDVINGEHYMESLGRRSAKRAIAEADILIDSLKHQGDITIESYSKTVGNYVFDIYVAYKTVYVPEQGHYETQIIKEAWTEEILVKEAGWY